MRGQLTVPASVAGTNPARWLFLVLVAGLALFAIERLWADRALPVSEASAPRLTVTGAADDYAEALAGFDLHRDSAVQRAEALNDGWLIHDIAARAWLFRARLTGSYDDYAAAEAAFRRGEAMADPGTGPHMTGAILSFGMHRLGEAERYLDQIDRYAVPPDASDRAEQRAMRGDIALYRGDYARAWTLYGEADRIAPGTADFRRAIYLSKTGRVDEAERFFNRAERRLASPTRHARAFHELQRGILDLDHGRLDQALTHFRRANEIFPGYWLIEEHMAETLALQGDVREAERIYRDVIRKTGHPEFMDALAGVLAEQGRAEEARQLTDAAWNVWQKRLTQFPEAAYGHAIDHCIDKGDLPCALRMAERNHAARPYGDAKIALARVLLASGRAQEAEALVQSVLASPWRTPDLQDLLDELRPRQAALGRQATNS